MSWREIEARHGSAGARRALGELGGHLGAPVCWREIEARHGSAGARRALGDLGHLGAPHVLARDRGAATAPPGRDERWGGCSEMTALIGRLRGCGVEADT